VPFFDEEIIRRTGEGRDHARELLSLPRTDWEGALRFHPEYRIPETFYAAADLIAAKTEREPRPALEDALELYRLLEPMAREIAEFDEPDSLLGEAALVVGRAYRILDATELAETWLDRAVDAFSRSSDAEPELAKAKLLRVVVRIHQNREEEGLAMCREADPVLSRYGMQDELWRSRVLQAYCLNVLGCPTDAIPLLERAIDHFERTGNGEFAARSLQVLGNIYAESGAFAKAAPLLERSAEFFKQAGNRVALLQVKWGLADAVRLSGSLQASVPLFEEIIQGYLELQMPNWSAGLRLIQAETLLQLERPAEAEWQVRQALPYLDRPDARPEAMAAVVLLKRAVESRKVDRDCVRRAREALEAS
jgi:tetratricopeptide (TPR) repeat protein